MQAPRASIRVVHRPPLFLIRLACICYVILLSWLLLAQDPLPFVFAVSDFLGDVPVPTSPEAHFAAFVVLGALALVSEWPLHQAIVGLLLIAFAIGTELLQGLVPGRITDRQDVLLNLAGLLMGAFVYACYRSVIPRKRPEHKVFRREDKD